jgi:broad specificity phosphatase PhoE
MPAAAWYTLARIRAVTGRADARASYVAALTHRTLAARSGTFMQVTILFVTHSTSEDNEAGLASGHADTPLSGLGLEQARRVGERLAEREIDLVVCSDLQRSWRTAEVAFEGRDLLVRRDVRLREIDYGDMTQAPRALVEAQRLSRIERPFHGGESYRQAIDRHRQLLDELALRHADEQVLLIGHGVTYAALEHLCRDVSLADAVEALNNRRWEPLVEYLYDPRATAPHREAL